MRCDLGSLVSAQSWSVRGWRTFCTSRRRAAKGRLSCPRTGCGTGDAACLDLDLRLRDAPAPTALRWRKTHRGRCSAPIGDPGFVARGGGIVAYGLTPSCAKTGFPGPESVFFALLSLSNLHLPVSVDTLKIHINLARQEICTRAASHLKTWVPVRRIADLIADPGPSRNPHTRRPLAWPPRCVTNQRAQSRNDTT